VITVLRSGLLAAEAVAWYQSPIVIAAIGLVGGLVGGGIAVYGETRLWTLQARHEAEAVLARYREPLLGAAYELQGRLWNILGLNFLGKYYLAGDEAQKTYAVENTLYVVAQYFGWSEILRREIQFMNFSDSKRTRVVNARQGRIVELFQSDDPRLGRPFLVWRGEQRAIGELMIESDADRVHCLGYAGFIGRRETTFRSWFERLETDIDALARGTTPRLLELQHALVDLIRELDPQGLRYSDDDLLKV
jgi:hypothetical protein